MIEWTERYSVHTATLPAGTMSVAWQDGGRGYKVSALGRSLKALEPDLARAKDKARSLAHKLLTESLESLTA